MKASIMVDEAESRSITLSSAPPHKLTLALTLRAYRSKQQRTHESDLYVVNNRMMVTFSSALASWVIGSSEVTASRHHHGDLVRGANVCVVLMRPLKPLKEKLFPAESASVASAIFDMREV